MIKNTTTNLAISIVCVIAFYVLATQIIVGDDILPQGYTLDEYRQWQVENPEIYQESQRTGKRMVIGLTATAALYPLLCVGVIAEAVISAKKKDRIK